MGLEVQITPAKVKNWFAIKVKGESMYPTIKSGDMVVADPDALPILDGEVCLIAIGNYEYTLMRVFYDLGEIILKPDNDDFPTRRFPKEEIKAIPIVYHLRGIEQLRRK